MVGVFDRPDLGDYLSVTVTIILDERVGISVSIKGSHLRLR